MDIKEQILTASLARFNSQGVSQTTVRHITTELGIGLGHFSYYFRKKDDLINALYLRWIDELEAHVTPFTSGTVEVQFAHLLGSVREATRIIYRYKFLMLDWAGIMRTVEPVRQHYRQHIARRRQELMALFSQLVADGYYRPPAHPQQLLMLDVAADAMADAGLGEPTHERVDTGVFIGIGLDLNTTQFRFRWKLLDEARRWASELELDLDGPSLAAWTAQLRDAAGPPLTANRTMGALGGIVASRVARAFHVGGPSFTISNEEASGLRALEVGVRALQRGELNVALVGAVDLAGDVRAVLGQEAAWTDFDPAADPSPVIGEGAAAVVLKRYDDAIRDGDRIYAVIREIGSRLTPAAGGAAEEEITSVDAKPQWEPSLTPSPGTPGEGGGEGFVPPAQGK